jgi:hypothetical protein
MKNPESVIHNTILKVGGRITEEPDLGTVYHLTRAQMLAAVSDMIVKRDAAIKIKRDADANGIGDIVQLQGLALL